MQLQDRLVRLSTQLTKHVDVGDVLRCTGLDMLFKHTASCSSVQGDIVALLIVVYIPNYVPCKARVYDNQVIAVHVHFKLYI